MSDSEAEVEPKVVEYDPITGVPSEFNEFLPHDCAEWKKWKAALESGLEGAMAELEVKEKTQDGEEIEKKLPGGKVKKKAKPEIVLERNVRNKRKCVTTVTGLDIFKVKLGEASKLFGKKFASGASVVKNATGKEQIDIQGDCLDGCAELIIKLYGKENGIDKKDIYYIDNKQKLAYFDEE